MPKLTQPFFAATSTTIIGTATLAAAVVGVFLHTLDTAEFGVLTTFGFIALAWPQKQSMPQPTTAVAVAVTPVATSPDPLADGDAPGLRSSVIPQSNLRIPMPPKASWDDPAAAAAPYITPITPQNADDPPASPSAAVKDQTP